MNERLYHLIEIYSASTNNDISKKIEHFDAITNSLFFLTQSLFEDKVQIKYHHRELEGKVFRFGLANQSLINLIRGNHFTLIKTKTCIGDIFSINSIIRMQIESYLIMYYLFFDNVNDHLKDFRYDIYKLHGLQKQISFKVSIETAETKKDIEKITEELNNTIRNIENSEFYKMATQKEKLAYLKPKYAKLVKSDVLFEGSGINGMRAKDMWHIYSNHAHSEHISDRQFNTAYRDNNSITDNCSLILTLSSIMTSKLILKFKALYESVEIRYAELNSAERHHIEFWSTY